MGKAALYTGLAATATATVFPGAFCLWAMNDEDYLLLPPKARAQFWKNVLPILPYYVKEKGERFGDRFSK